MSTTIQNVPTPDPLERVTATWYRAEAWTDTIAPVPVVEVTEHTLLILERPAYSYSGAALKEKRILRADNPSLFPTREEAVGYIVTSRRKAMDEARATVARHTSALARLREEYPEHPAFAEEV